MNLSDITLVITVGTITFILVSVFITLFSFVYRQRLNLHEKEKQERESIFQQEILRAQLEMQEQTFRNISQEIHDNIGQILSLTRLHVSTIPTEPGSPAEQKINYSKELLDQAIQDLRDLSKQINTDFATQQSLSDILRFQLNLLERTGLYATSLEIQGGEKPVDPEKKLIIFRIAQEALNNILKHAEATSVSVAMLFTPALFTLQIKDNGRGLNVESEPKEGAKGIGTGNMHYRAKLIGADFKLQSKPHEGCLVQLELPLTPE